jgi:hypothetical protein
MIENLTCPRCGQILPENASSCPFCGAQVSGEQARPTLPLPGKEDRAADSPPPQPGPPQRGKNPRRVLSLVLLILLVWFILSVLLILVTYFFLLPAQPNLPTGTPAAMDAVRQAVILPKSWSVTAQPWYEVLFYNY